MTRDTFEDLMGEMAYGLYIIGSSQDVEADGMMADWVMQVSFNPRLVAVALENDARTLQNIRCSHAFTVNFLSQEEHSMRVAARFAQPYFDAKIGGRDGTAVKVHHKLEDLPYTRTARGAPVLDDAMGWFECEAADFIPTGDHTLVIGRVVGGEVRREAEPLTSTYTGWNYSG